MIKRLEGIQRGQQVYIIPSDPRHSPYWTKVISVGPKKIKVEGTPDLRGFDPNTGRSIRWGGWEMYLSEFQLKKEEELINLRYDLIQTFEIFVSGCKDIEKLKRLTKRYSKYNENNQSI